MYVHAVADEIGIRLRRKDHALAEPMGRSPRHLAGNHRMVGGAQGRLRRYRHLELARPVFCEEAVRDWPGGAQRGDERLAEIALAAEGAERIGIARAVVSAGIDEFLLERGQKTQPRHRLEFAGGAAQKIARTAFPGSAVGGAEVAEKEMLGRRTVAEIDPDLGRRVGNDHQIAGGAKGRVPDRPGRRHHQIAAGPADAFFEPSGQFARREPFAPHMPRNVAGRDKDEFFADHARPCPAAANGAYLSSNCKISSRLKSGTSSSAPSIPAAR